MIFSIWDDMNETMSCVSELRMQTLELDSLGFEFWLHPLLDVYPYKSHLSSLRFSFFICQMMVVVRIKRFNMCKVPIKQCGAV